MALSSQLDRASSKYEADKIIRRWCHDNLPIWEPVVTAVSTPSAQSKFQGRKGAKAVRKLEYAADSSSKLTPEGATAYRALSARCNYLAQGKPDISFAAKELCLDVSVPSLQSLDKLKRAIRYLKATPRLV